MSVIAWDGHTLAADKRACLGTLIRTTTKIFRIGDSLAGYAGSADQGEEMLAWLRNGAEIDRFPASQRDEDGWASVIVVSPGGKILKYERTPHPLQFEDLHFALGCGRDFALAAMYLGCDARRAVEVTCALDNGCGNGVDTLTL